MQISLSFGGSFWPISAADMNVELPAGNGQCIGAIKDMGNSSGGGYWIIGDTFLVCNYGPLHWDNQLNHKNMAQKNVYTVLRASPPSIGFAQLSSELTATTGIATATTAYVSSTSSQFIQVPSHLIVFIFGVLLAVTSLPTSGAIAFSIGMSPALLLLALGVFSVLCWN